VVAESSTKVAVKVTQPSRLLLLKFQGVGASPPLSHPSLGESENACMALLLTQGSKVCSSRHCKRGGKASMLGYNLLYPR
jgi:hypothetical protein